MKSSRKRAVLISLCVLYNASYAAERFAAIALIIICFGACDCGCKAGNEHKEDYGWNAYCTLQLNDSVSKMQGPLLDMREEAHAVLLPVSSRQQRTARCAVGLNTVRYAQVQL